MINYIDLLEILMIVHVYGYKLKEKRAKIREVIQDYSIQFHAVDVPEMNEHIVIKGTPEISPSLIQDWIDTIKRNSE